MRTPLPINLDTLLRHRTIEGERVEYKAGWNPESALPTICAFANDFHNLGGGYLVIGVEEKDGLPVLPPRGIDPSRVEAIQKELLQLGHQAIQPPFHPISAAYTVDQATLLVVWAPGGETRPYKARVSLAKGSKDWAWFIRRGSSTVRARGADERELLGLAATVPFDDRCNRSATLDDLSRRLVGEFLDEVGSELARDAHSMSMESLGRQMNVVGGPSEALFPKNVGLLFFNDEPHRFFPATQIDVVYFPEGAGGDRFEEKVFQGPLGRITRDSIAYIERNYLKETVIKHPERSEAERFWNFPRVAIEEAIVNAVYHRSYEEREPIEVRIDPEALVVLSFPGPDRSVRMEDLRAGKAVSRRYRNRRIGELLKELDLTEGRSTGVPKILRAMRENGSPPAEFESDEDRTYFMIRLPVHERADRGDGSGEARLVATPHVTPQVTPHVTPQVTPQVERLLAVVEGELLREQLQRRLRISDRKYLRIEFLAPAISAGLLEMTIPDKPNSRKQRYRLTDLGKRFQTELAARGQDNSQRHRA
jgi:ATP-dependent DNA helicase RecG